MASMLRITGISKVVAGLDQLDKKLGVKAQRALNDAATFLARESLAIVPVQVGNLKNSWFKRNIGGSGFQTHLLFGYTAKYAVFVHEDLSKTHGKEFNVKHADEIANAGRWSSNIDTRKTTFNAYGKMGKAKGGMFPRGENQQAKFLEVPIRLNRRKLLRIIYNEMKI